VEFFSVKTNPGEPKNLPKTARQTYGGQARQSSKKMADKKNGG
jgi:hypothetical protein